jgi:hypothetical protein
MNKNINRYYPIAIGYKRLLPPTMVDVLHCRYKLRRSGAIVPSTFCHFCLDTKVTQKSSPKKAIASHRSSRGMRYIRIISTTFRYRWFLDGLGCTNPVTIDE